MEPGTSRFVISDAEKNRRFPFEPEQKKEAGNEEVGGDGEDEEGRCDAMAKVQ